jgi:sugar phosphate isomerase/epimerase
MSAASFTLSAFGDEIAADLDEQLRVLRELDIPYLDLRAAWGVNVLRMDPEQLARVAESCAAHGVGVACIGSPIGKSPIVDDLEQELGNLARVLRAAERLNTRRVRIFSFYPPDTGTNAHYDEYVGRAASRLARLAEMAQREGLELLLENEKGIVGDTPERCQALLAQVDSPALRFLWDPANFVQVGVAAPTKQGWPLLKDTVGYVHVKDARVADGGVTPAGEGDGQVAELLAALRDAGYRGFLSLEPHLAIAGHSSGFSGAEGMARAVRALRTLMAEAGCVETEA